MATQYWKCEGTIAKYERPCPQKFLFYNEDKVDLDTLKTIVQIKCPRCGSIAGGVGWS